ncbi:MAG: hypothetical protein ACLFTA_02310 [Candidatus Nanohaloarchaea archaeon]
MSKGPNLVKSLEQMPKIDALAIGALGLNIYIVFQLSGLSLQDLMEPMASEAVTVIQVSGLVALLYLVEFMGDEEDNSRNTFASSSSDEGFLGWIAGLAEGSKVVDAVSIAAVFLGYNYISQNAGYGASITELSMNPEVIAMQLSVLMMLNFGIFLISDLMSS